MHIITPSNASALYEEYCKLKYSCENTCNNWIDEEDRERDYNTQ